MARASTRGRCAGRAGDGPERRAPDLELDERNLISLCETEDDRPSEDHHLLVGHFDDFKSSKLDVVKDASVTFFGSSGAEVRASEAWKRNVEARLPRLERMSEQEKAALVRLMNHTFPKR